MVTTNNGIIVLVLVLLTLLIFVSITRIILETKFVSHGFLYSLDEEGSINHDIVLFNDDDNDQRSNTNINNAVLGMKVKQYQNSSLPVASALLEEYFGKVPSVIIAGTQKGVSFEI